jgi:multidrug transporter EmrE-like cation transporter
MEPPEIIRYLGQASHKVGFVTGRNSMSYIILILAITFNAIANILMKVGMLKEKPASNLMIFFTDMLLNPVLIAGMICFALGLAAYCYVLTKLNLSIAYPIMTSVGYVIVIIASWLFLKETITVVQVAGFAFIIAGVWMVAH